MDNLYELIGAGTGITGAILLALKCRISAWAWPLWIISGISWIIYAQQTSTYGLLAQQIVFTTINLIGTWRWLIEPILQKTRTMTGNTATQPINRK